MISQACILASNELVALHSGPYDEIEGLISASPDGRHVDSEMALFWPKHTSYSFSLMMISTSLFDDSALNYSDDKSIYFYFL